MVECWLPYGKTEVHISIPLRNLIGMAEPDLGQPAPDQRQVVTESLLNPLGTKPLSEILDPGASVAVALDGTITPHLATTAVSSIADQIVQVGSSLENVIVVIGNGCREQSDPELLEALKGDESLEGISVVEHTRRSTTIIEVGTTSGKTNVEVNSNFVGADLHIVVGDVRIDPYTGFGGAHSTILPGISGQSTVEENRRRAFEENAAPGVIEANSVLADVMEAARLSRVDIAVNLIPNPNGRLLKAFSGGVEESWRRAVQELGDSYKVKADSNADIIVISSGGSKFDFDLYHGIWALHSASLVAKKGATIILLAECSEGLGVDGISKLSHIDSLSELRRRYLLGGEVVHLIKSTLRRNEVVLVSALPDHVAEPLGFSGERTANEGLSTVVARRRGKRTLVVTHGCSTLPVVA